MLDKGNTHDSSQEPVVGKKFEARGLDVRLETVQLNTVAIVYKDVFFLCDSEMRMVVQKPGIGW